MRYLQFLSPACIADSLETHQVLKPIENLWYIADVSKNEHFDHKLKRLVRFLSLKVFGEKFLQSVICILSRCLVISS